MSTNNLVKTKEVDYLDEDKPIRGQNYVCLSFVSPEDVIRNKEAYYFERYLAKFSSDVVNLFENLLLKFPESADIIKGVRENHEHMFKGVELESDFKFFKEQSSEKIEKEYSESIDFQTSIRGIKVRGVFESLKEAQVRAELLRRLGDKFDIFVGQVGVWCPWSPNAADIQEQEYAETQLNTLVKNYRENMTLRDEFYAKRKDEKIADAQDNLKKNRFDKTVDENEIIETVVDPPAIDDGAPAPAAAEPPAIADEAPAAAEPPAIDDVAPAVADGAPAAAEPPAVADGAPAIDDGAPAIDDGAPAAAEPPAVAEVVSPEPPEPPEVVIVEPPAIADEAPAIAEVVIVEAPAAVSEN